MQFLGSCIVLLGALAAVGQAPVVLENGHVRLEIEPRTFSLHFAGFPGGKNFLDVIHVPATEIAAAGWLEPGGVTTDLLPEVENSALMRRGPAEVIVSEDHYLLLMGPMHPERDWRIKKEYFLTPGRSEVRYKVTVLSPRKEERRAGIRITAQVPRNGRLHVPAAPGTLGLLRGDFPDFSGLREAGGDSFAIPVSARDERRSAVVAVPSSEVTLETDFGRWKRRMEVISEIDGGGSQSPRLLVLLDDPAHRYQCGLEVVQSGVNVGAPLVVVEHWEFSPPEPGASG